MLYSIIIGGIAGWLAGRIMKGGGFGIFKNILLGFQLLMLLFLKLKKS